MALQLRHPPPREKPLREAGPSLDEEIQGVIARDRYEALVPAGVLAAGVLAMVAVWEWFRWYDPTPRPGLLTVLALVAIGWAGFKRYRAREAARRLGRGRDDEREVADALELLRARGFHVFRDVQGDGFNVDLLLVGPQGLFVVDTRTPGKPLRGRATIRYNGEALAVAGERPRREPIQHALALARWVSDLVNDSTSRNCFVRPVVLYPGWFIEITIKKPSVWILSPRMLPGWLTRERTCLSAEDIALISRHITRHVGSGDHVALDDHARSQ